ncbi:histidine phosphatase family protein [Gordonia humi]|uniref:Broad specificity phosphatase PhoE n=1 Tax=Gordonia humi TaxID=686429 RepID=A0A840EX38_9ACTN|nr:histidine phosphatase family protein [Gordonia humi]MBB4133489.1 broad specificity phosphatase PhoE [Gordonia humi]
MGAIYLVRHGQAPAHAYGVGTATGDAPGLTDLGFEQARRSGVLLAGMVPAFDATISGALPRQRATLQGVMAAFDPRPEHVVDADWDEYSVSDIVAGSVDAATYADRAAYQRLVDTALSDWIDGTTTGDESYAEYAARTTAAAQRAADLAGSGANVLVVSSAGTITQLLAQLWQVPPQGWPTLSRAFVNASVTKVISGKRGLSVVSVNEHAHLARRGEGMMTYR